MPGTALVAITDAQGRIRALNQHCESACGFTLAEVQNQPIWETLLAPEFARMMKDAILGAVAGNVIEDQQGLWSAKDGSRFTVRWGVSAVRDAEGALHGVVVSGTDLRASRLMEIELGEALDRHQAILDTAVDGIITIGARGRVESFNRAAERIFGYRASEVIGRNISMLMPTPYREQHDGYLDQYLTTRRKKIIGIGREVEGLRKDGTVFPLELSVGEVVISGSRVFTGIIRDVTDRKHIELEARRRQDELAHVTRLHSMGDLASGLAHEINQPLTAILNHSGACLRMIDAGTADLDLLRDSMAQIARQGERAAEVIRRLRKYVEKGEIEMQLLDVTRSIAEVMALLQHELKIHGVHVAIDSAEDTPPVLLDAVQFEQVLVNVIRNAIEAMVEASTPDPQLNISVTPSATPAGVDISISDSGPGFGDVPVDKLFEPFHTTKPMGLGQGLSICRRIIDAHSGQIWAESTPEGAHFHIWLPRPT